MKCSLLFLCLLLSLALVHANPLLPLNLTLSPSPALPIVAPVESKIQAATNPVAPVSQAINAINNAISTAASQISSAAAAPISSIQTQTQQIVASPAVAPTVHAVERTSSPSEAPTKQIIPTAITSIPSSLASQAQSQISGIQSQASTLGGSALSQIQSQMSSAQSQITSLPSTIGGMLPTGIWPGSKVVAPQPTAPVDPVIEQPAFLSEPINQTTKLVMDVNDQITKYLPSEDPVVTTIAPSVYAADAVVEAKDERQQPQIAMLIDQVNRLADTIEGTITDLISRGRNVTAGMLRSTLGYVRRVRNNLERLQTRLQFAGAPGQNSTVPQVSATATVSNSNIPGAAFFNTIRDRINRMTEEISALVNRIRGSFIPGSTPVDLTSTIAPQVTVVNFDNIGAAAASGTILSTINSLNSQTQNSGRPVK